MHILEKVNSQSKQVQLVQNINMERDVRIHMGADAGIQEEPTFDHAGELNGRVGLGLSSVDEGLQGAALLETGNQRVAAAKPVDIVFILRIHSIAVFTDIAVGLVGCRGTEPKLVVTISRHTR